MSLKKKSVVVDGCTCVLPCRVVRRQRLPTSNPPLLPCLNRKPGTMANFFSRRPPLRSRPSVVSVKLQVGLSVEICLLALVGSYKS